jgi:hypothetical protein
MDWAKVFDESYKQTGASDPALNRFVASVLAPLTCEEIDYINRNQRNPFPRTDPMYAHFRPFDPRAWVLPTGLLPESYLSFLRWSNGGEFRTGEREFGFFDADGARGMLLGYNLPQYMPGALPIAFNGGGIFYLFDMRRPPVRGEYPVVCASAGNIGWGADEHAVVAANFPKCCRGKVRVEDLLR